MTYHPVQGYYQHVDGGLYFLEKIGKSTVDLSEHVVYTHIYPFEKQTWIRPLAEWAEPRFKLIKETDAIAIMLSTDRAVMQVAVSEQKAARRLREGR